MHILKVNKSINNKNIKLIPKDQAWKIVNPFKINSITSLNKSINMIKYSKLSTMTSMT